MRQKTVGAENFQHLHESNEYMLFRICNPEAKIPFLASEFGILNPEQRGVEMLETNWKA